MMTIERYLDALRYALNHLYDPNAQRTSPLVEIFGLADRSNVGYALQEALIEGIESLKADAEVPAHSHLRRSYEVLLFRYVQQWSQQEVADQLGVSPRHLRREQHLALEVLAQQLAQRFHIALESADDHPIEVAELPNDEGSALDDELAWLSDARPAEPIELYQILPAVLCLARPMACEHHVTLQCDELSGLPPLVVHAVALRQILLSVLGMAIRHASGGRVAITAQVAGWGVGLTVRAPGSPAAGLSENEAATLAIVHRVLRACGGRLEFAPRGDVLAATVTLPAHEQVPVLTIDDSADTLALIRRYLSGTRYRFLGARTFSEALDLTRQYEPHLILLDVMMPQFDGWELLGRLRQHPLTCQVPIIICTILAEEELALSLGASDFMRKPVSRQVLLQVLDRHLEPQTSA